MKTNNNFRPNFTTLGDRMMPAVGLLAAPVVGAAATVRTAHHDVAATDAIWVGDQTATAKGVIAVDNQNVNTHDAISVDSLKATVNEGNSVNVAVATHDVWVGSPMAAPTTPLDPLSQWKSKVISEKDLRPGDIMLTTVHDFKSGVIAVGTFSVYTHAALYIGNGRVIEAIGTGVREISLKDYLKENSAAMVIRAKGLSDSQMDQLAKFAQSKVGKPYDKAGAIASARLDWTKTPWGNPDRDSYYCSNLVTSAFKSIGNKLFISLEQTPGDLANLARDPLFSKSKVDVIGNLKA